MTSCPQNARHPKNLQRAAHFLVGCAVVFLLLGFVSSTTRARVDRYLPQPKGSHSITNVIRMEETHLPLAELAAGTEVSWEDRTTASEAPPPAVDVQQLREVLLAFHPLRSPPFGNA